jgi:hypothetical protein
VATEAAWRKGAVENDDTAQFAPSQQELELEASIGKVYPTPLIPLSFIICSPVSTSHYEGLYNSH